MDQYSSLKDRFANLKSFYYNQFCQNIKQKNGKLFLYPNSVCDLHKTSKVYLNDDFYINFNRFKGSKAEAFLRMQENSELHIYGSFKLYYNATIQVFKGGNLTLGKGYINSDSVIACCNRIKIGDGAAIARGVYIYDGDHHSIIDEKGVVLNPSKSINIGNHVWIGVKSTILKGVTIGDGAIISAGAVVTSDVPPNSVAMGVPAKVIRKNVQWK